MLRNPGRTFAAREQRLVLHTNIVLGRCPPSMQREPKIELRSKLPRFTLQHSWEALWFYLLRFRQVKPHPPPRAELLHLGEIEQHLRTSVAAAQRAAVA